MDPLVKTRLRAAVAAHRHNPLVRAAMRTSFLILNAGNNQYNWNFEANGEVWTVKWAVQTYPGVIFDVGSNQGQWAMAALPHIEERPLHCFEAVPETFESLRTNLSGHPTAILNDVGLGSKPGNITFHHSKATPEVSSRYNIADEYQASRDNIVNVQITTGDEYCRSRAVDRIALLKVDVEGMEYEVLDGFRGMLENQRIGAVQFEYGEGYIGGRRYLGDVCELLQRAGYGIFKQFPRGIEPFRYSTKEENFQGRNFVAALKSDRNTWVAQDASLPAKQEGRFLAGGSDLLE